MTDTARQRLAPPTNQLLPLELLPRSEWHLPYGDNPDRFAIWMSAEFMVQVWIVAGGIIRLAINRSQRISGSRLFAEGITWDELQEIKRRCGYGDRLAVEIYPEDQHILNDMNARHLWILPDRPAFAWTIDQQTGKVNKPYQHDQNQT